MEIPKISIIVSTYNAEEWLKKVLWGFEQQIFKDFEVVIADDGSNAQVDWAAGSAKRKKDYS
jgi:glycosyltransferase involved in cell wall biosynthesis